MFKLKNTHSFVNITIFFISIIVVTISSCKKNENIQEIPSYISIEYVNLETISNQGANTHNITDVWLYVNDQFRGAYELPADISTLITLPRLLLN